MTNSMYAAGATRTGTRDSKDRYETPGEIVTALLEREAHSEDVLEPACGTGRVVRALEGRGHDVTAFDLHEDGLDFLDYDSAHANVVTNPPFMNDLHMKFAEHAYRNVATEKVSLLVPLTFLTTEKRFKFFQRMMPTSVWIIPNRIRFYRPVEDVLLYLEDQMVAAADDGKWDKATKLQTEIDVLTKRRDDGEFEPHGGVRIPSQTFNHCWITWTVGEEPEHPALRFMPPIPEEEEGLDLI